MSRYSFFSHKRDFFSRGENNIPIKTTWLLVTRNYKSPYQIEVIKWGRLNHVLQMEVLNAKRHKKNA